jgi:predicted adenylyl cyclase CyaB
LGIETEIKVSIHDIGSFCRKLEALNCKAATARHFEDNYLLDFSDHRLRSGQCIVRIRSAGGQVLLTFKGAPRSEGIFKVREELETTLASASVALQILQRLGMEVWFRYQKYRQEYIIELDAPVGGNIHVAVDETPVGNYAEFEGSEKAILELAGIMGIPESRFLRASYYALYLDYCRERRTIPGDMVFPNAPENLTL